MEFTLGTMPTTHGDAVFSRAVRVSTYAYDYRAFYVSVVWSHRSDSACGWSLTSKRVRVPYLTFRTAYRFRRLGALHVYRWNQKVMNRIFR